MFFGTAGTLLLLDGDTAFPLHAAIATVIWSCAERVRQLDSLERSTRQHAGGSAMDIRRDDDTPPELDGSAEAAAHVLRRLDLSSSVSLLFVTLLLLPISFAYASLLVFPFGGARTPIVITFFALGLILFVRPIEAKIMHRFFKVQQPTEHQLQRLLPVWSSVLRRSHVDGTKFVLAVDNNSVQPNASAIGGHVVAVTVGAMNLPDDELAGILAHELGHHLGFHPFALAMKSWLSLPLLAVASIARFIIDMSVRIGIAGWWWLRLPLLTVIMFLVGLLFSLFARVLRVVLWITQFVIILVGRSAEYTADHTAVQLGFGSELLAALESSAGDDACASQRTTLTAMLWDTHPPLRKRIARISLALAVQEGWKFPHGVRRQDR
jgi:Zn-dependent protease with chaperone function